MSKFLDYDGLEHYTQKIKTGMDSIIQNGTKNLLNSTISYVGGNPDGKTHYVINNDGSITLTKTYIKVNKVYKKCYRNLITFNAKFPNSTSLSLMDCSNLLTFGVTLQRLKIRHSVAVLRLLIFV